MGSISTIDPVVFRNANAQYDPKTFRFIGGLGRGGSVIFVNKAAEPRLYDKSAKPVMIGSVQSMPRPGTQPILWSIEYLGWNGAWVGGYRGTNETMFALDRGEIDMTATGNIFQIQDRLNSGQLKIVYQTGALKDGRIVGRADFGAAPLFPDLMKGKITDPIAQKAFRLWTTLNTGDKWLALAQGTPDAILAAYRDAFDKLARRAGVPGAGREDQRRLHPDVGARRRDRGRHAGRHAERGGGLYQDDDAQAGPADSVARGLRPMADRLDLLTAIATW